MVRAALDLFAERGYEQTTASDIAERAGVTERTFFRHFADKREVLFDGAGVLQQVAYEAVLAQPAKTSPLEAALAGIVAAGGLFEDRHAFAVRRACIVAAHPSLQERELLKLATLTDTTTNALLERGVEPTTASLAAHSAVIAFHVAFARWVSAKKPPNFDVCVKEAAQALRALK
jgi:AcrR family transcriptional regulator